ncbi:PAS domain S-box protein [Tianweitania sp. BSSL-BM11]|uniref:histidine kinase n=1 Tax=Tianweitania aestuarii TaxID=2814886 RepID=A0ABS5RQW8_9HYPH|nr:histidine kinase dimerization/phospho-acceptor domain-containing protein [Tianweitania aestuarii]MBS9719440.1 PAS domain S-box protein [Tianweitania aestuarii]
MDQLYSFIDVVALEPVRGGFAAGEALVIFSRSMEEIIWTNGPGAAALGFSGIEAAIGADNPLPALARRQIAATPGYPQIGRNKAVSIRLGGLLTTRLTQLMISEVTLPDGEQALLVAFPEGFGRSGGGASLQRAVSGFGTQGQFVAMLDADGAVLAATPGFERAGIAQDALAELAAAANGSPPHVAKKRLRGGSDLYPAGLARVGDEPALYFLIVIGEADAVASEPAHEQDHDGPLPAEIVPEGQQAAPVAQATQVAAAPVRFVWRTDAEGRFAALSEPFLKALGIDAEAVMNRSFRDVATDLGFDADGEITGLLERRDTWSGRSVLWPLADRSLRVPVDLAALPIYDRERRFDGFRGFGVARLADAVAPAEPTGEAISASEPDIDRPATSEVPAPASDLPSPLAEDDRPTAITEAPVSDEKIVQLSAHRQASAERTALSNSERIAFREIGTRLKAAEAPVEATPDKQPEQPEALTDANKSAASAPDATLETGDQQSAAIVAEEPVMPDVADDAAEAPDQAEHAQPDEPIVSAPELEPEPATSTYDPTDDEDLIARSAIEGGSRRRSTLVAPLVPYLEHLTPSSSEESETVVAEDAVASRLEQAREEAEQAVSPVEEAETAEAEDIAPVADADDWPVVAEASEIVDETFVGIEPLAADAPVELDVEAEPALSETPAADDAAVHEEPEPSNISPVSVVEDESQPSPGAAEIELVEALPIPLIIHAGDRLDFANREFFALTGYANLDAIAQAGGLEALFVDAADGEDGCRCQVLRTQGGEEIPVQAHLQSVPWGGGKSLMLTLRRVEIVAQPAPLEAEQPADEPERPSNVTHLPFAHPARAVEPAPVADPGVVEELARTRALLEEMRAIVDTATDGVILIDRQAQIRSISHPAEALFGFDSASVEGTPFTSLFAIESQRAVKDYLTGLTDNGVASVLNDGREVIGREAQGRFIPLFITIGRLPGDSGFCAVVREITQWKRAEEELTHARAEAERVSSQKSDFLARVSHEIRTPLNAIIGFSELMMEERFGAIGNERYRDYLRDINRSGNHVLDLVNDLLDISKIEAGEQELSYVAVSLNDALSEAVAIMQPQANRERVIIRSSFASRLPDVVADLRSVRQIALNLLSNAVRYTQAGGQVIVSTVYETSGEVILRIRDTGVGMSSAEIDQALKPFKQLNALKRARGDGTGLGLPLTKAMVEANRASFVINSRPGDGTLVEVTFPSTRVLAD